jgi:hypothetical protein
MPNAQVGVLTQALVLLHRPLNCPWRASAAAALVRSTLSVPAAAIGVIQLAARMLATSASVAALPACSPPAERAEALFAALRIDTLIRLGERLGLSVKLTTKVARDAYATTLKKSRVSIEAIAEMLGQTSTAVTKHYLDSFDQEQIHEINNFLP